MTGLDAHRFVFDRTGSITFAPSPFAAGPYRGLQGGAVAGLAATVIENQAPDGLVPLTFHVDFVRPAPLDELTVDVAHLHTGRRLHRYTATVSAHAKVVVHASMTLIRPAIIKGFPESSASPLRPAPTAAAYERTQLPYPWMMDVFDAVVDEGIFWFRWRLPLAAGATAFTHLVGPADSAHGLSLETRYQLLPVTGWPNTDLSIHLTRQPRLGWLGLRPGVNREHEHRFRFTTWKSAKKESRPCLSEYQPPTASAPKSTPCSARTRIRDKSDPVCSLAMRLVRPVTGCVGRTFYII